MIISATLGGGVAAAEATRHPPRAHSWPDATSTGPPPSIRLRPLRGNREIRVNGAVLRGVNLYGSLDVYANDVTIENSVIHSANWWAVNLRPGFSGLRVLHCRIEGLVGAGPDGGGEDYAVSDMSEGSIEIAYDDVSEFGDALSLGNGYVHDNYVHDLQAFIPQNATSYQHTDDLISDGADGRGLMVDHNTFLNQLGPHRGASAAIGLFANNGPVTNTTVTDNLIAGGAYALYAGGAGASRIRITGNHFSTRYWAGAGVYGPVAYWNARGHGNVWTGNEWADGRKRGRAVAP